MSVPTQENQSQPQETRASDKEMNFRMLEQRYQKQLAQEREAREAAERELQKRSQPVVEEDDESEPYVDHKRLQKKLEKSESRVIQQTQSEIQKAVNTALREERKNNWLKQNSDFYDVLDHAEKLALKDPDLAESLLEMPESFERQKLVYKNIKALGLHREAPKEPSIQETIDAKRKGPYYQPTNVGTAPYSSQGDFSTGGQKNAYDKMQELKARLRL